MKTKARNTKKKSGVTISKALDKYDGIVIAPKKLEQANAILAKVGLPKDC